MLLFIAGVLFAFSAAVTAQSGDDLDPTTDSPDAAVSWEWLISTSSESDLDLTLANPGDKALVEQTVNGYTQRY